MSADTNSSGKLCKLVHMLMYATGECAYSLVVNGITGFLMLYYTKALGLNPKWAGIAISVSIFWEAISEPVMGHVSDNTRSRYGRRHGYMLFGGLLMAGFFYLIWRVPQVFLAGNLILFAYLLVMNLLLRTGITLFFIPYMALGFEMCGDYQGRSKIQSLRFIFNMIANIAGPALAWKIFFSDRGGIQATSVPGNYVFMGLVFAVVAAAVVILVTAITYRWHEDTRASPSKLTGGHAVRDFIADMKQIILDPNPRWVFIFTLIVCVGMVLVATLQMYVYDDFMRFPAGQKSIVHGGSMLGAGIGAAVAIFLSRLLDKKGTVVFGGTISIACNLMLGILFLTGWVSAGAVWHLGGCALPIAMILFVIFHAGYWLGNGMLLPIATAMIADAAEIHQIQTGENKDGGYSAVFSLTMRLAIAFSAIVSGFCLDWIGYQVPEAGKAGVVQSTHTLWWLGAITFGAGAVIAMAALLAIRNYRIDRRLVEKLRTLSGTSSGALSTKLPTKLGCGSSPS